MRTKLFAVMDEINSRAAEREELVEHIAIALLTRKNLFILGDTGQAKSYAINEFRKRITGAKQFERLMSKQVDEEQLFGRLDLASLIPGSMSRDVLMKDVNYKAYFNQIQKHYEDYSISGEEIDLIQAVEVSKKLDLVEKTLYALHGNSPQIKTDGKIPDSHIVFLDEIYKANDGILNSLLTALNERVYTNEGQTVSIPVISFFSASNEIPDFNDSAEKILKPLYDRFDLKVITEYVGDKQKRLDILSKKQAGHSGVNSVITLQELMQMQREVEKIAVPDKINELMDDILCELRRKNIHVSDRKYFNYHPIAQAKAYLRGGSEVSSSDLMILKNYLWAKPEEIPAINKLLSEMCENPIRSLVLGILARADESYEVAKEDKENDAANGITDNKRPFVKFRSELLRLYADLVHVKLSAVTISDEHEIVNATQQLETLSKKAHELYNCTYAPLEELKELQ